MAFSQTWDLEKYKSEFESEEHWQLRKKFMQEHKNQFPEEKLVCLARVFCNIEFLGCRYPEKTMKLVAELSKGVADDYREKQKGKLKRTFVQASDAAEAKAKGRGATPPDKITEGSPSKIPKISAPGTKYPCFVHEGVVKPRVQIKSDFPGFIIYESCKTTCPINILTQSAQKSKIWNSISFEFPAEKNSDPNNRCCEIFLNKKILSSGTGKTNKGAKVDAATEGLKKLRETCYTIQEKLSFFTDGEVVSKEQVEKKKETIALPQDNIGSKMMMKMGWTGAGLGKNQQGIKAPIEAAQTMRRAGFGHLSMPQFHTKFRNVFKDYIASGSTNDLVFAPDFSADERKILHKSIEDLKKVNLVDEDIEDDLFGFDSDSEVVFPSSSDEEEEEGKNDDDESCVVCRKLESLTGEESDDELFDKMWGTGSDTTGLVNISEEMFMSQKTNKSNSDPSDKAETNVEGQLASLAYQGAAEPSLPNASNEDLLLRSRVNAVVSNINQILEQRAMGQEPNSFLDSSNLPPFSNVSPLHQTSNYPKRYRAHRLRIFLPDGSFKRVRTTFFLANKELMPLLTFINNQPKSHKITVTFEDVRTSKALREIFPEVAAKLDAELGQQFVPHLQTSCGNPTADIDPDKISGSDSKIKTVSSEDRSDRVSENIQDLNVANMSTNIQLNSIQNEDGKVLQTWDRPKTNAAMNDLDQAEKLKLSNSSDMEIQSDESDKQTSIHSETVSKANETRSKRIRSIRVLVTLSDGSVVRINTNYLKFNNYYVRHARREKCRQGIAKGLFNREEFPPPDYSDSSSDESDNEWIPKNNLLISEPDSCEMNKVHVLRKNWERFILKFSKSKRNPFTKEWQKFVDQSPPDERKYLCQKWKEFLTTWNLYEAEKIPPSILQPDHELVASSGIKLAPIPPCLRSTTNLITVYLSSCGKLKVPHDLLLNKSNNGKKHKKLYPSDQTTSIEENLPELVCQLSEPEGTKDSNHQVQGSGNETFKPSEGSISECYETRVAELREAKTISSTARTSGIEEKLPELVHQSTEPEVTKECNQQVQDSGKETTKPSEGSISECYETRVAELGEAKQILDSVCDKEHHGCSENDEESSMAEISSSCKSSSEKKIGNKTRGKCHRVVFTLSDGSVVRINVNHLKYNSYFIRNARREKCRLGIANGLFDREEFPPPEYSDSSSDESDKEWIPKNSLLISEPDGCEINKVHVLRRNWERFILKFSTSKKNPFAKEWQKFVDQSPPDERKYLCQKWKEFLIFWQHHEAETLPPSILQPEHELVPSSNIKLAPIPPNYCSSPNTIKVYFTNFCKMKVNRDLIFTNKSYTGKKYRRFITSTDQTSGIEDSCPALVCQSTEPEVTKYPNKQVQDSGNETSKPSEGSISECYKARGAELREAKTISSTAQTSGKKDNFIELVFQSSEPEVTKDPNQQVQDSGNEISKPSEGSISECCETRGAELREAKTISNSFVSEGLNKEDSSEGESCFSYKTGLESNTCLKKHRYRTKKMRLTLKDGSKIRIKAQYLRSNKYYIQYKKRIQDIDTGSISHDEIPPPHYSDSSTDEDESDWVSNSGIIITEPENCEIDGIHILRKSWEQYILKVGSSKRNPVAKKWREFLDQSPVGGKKTLCQKWNDFVTTYSPNRIDLGVRVPELLMQEAHNKPLTSFSQIGSSAVTCNISGSMVSDGLQKHLQESTTWSSQMDLEKHINSSDLTVVHSSIDSPASNSTVKNWRVKSKSVKNPNLVTAYMGVGGKIKFDHNLVPRC